MDKLILDDLVFEDEKLPFTTLEEELAKHPEVIHGGFKVKVGFEGRTDKAGPQEV